MTRTEIQALIDNGQYAKAASETLDLLKEDLSKENWLLAAKAYILAIRPEALGEDSSLKTYLHCTTNAILFAHTLEELFEIREELLEYVYLAERNCAQEFLTNVANNLTFDSWNKYTSNGLVFSLFRKQVAEHIVESVNCVELALKENFPPEELAKKYDGETKKGFSDNERNKMLYTAICQGFENLKAYYKNNQHTDDHRGIGPVLLTAIGVLGLMAEICCKQEPATVEEQKRWLITWADICYFKLNAVLHSNTISMSITVGTEDRKKIIEKIEGINAEIRAIDPSYMAPPLPSEEPIKINHAASASSNTTSSGGCYVATAVYGSYDCPQVWTLRRYRDYTLAQTWYGRAFIRAYYAISPTLVKWFGQTAWFKKMWQTRLDRMVANLQAKGVKSTPYSDKEW